MRYRSLGADVGTRIRWDAAFKHEDETLCVYDADSGAWYMDNFGVHWPVPRVREICDREHVL